MNWLVDWGVSCSQGGCKENQDGWFVSIPAQKKSNKKENQEKRQTGELKDERLEKLGFSQGVWNFDPIQPNLTNAGTFSHQRMPDSNEDVRCLDDIISEAFPPVFPLFTLPPLPPKRNGPGWNSHSTGNKLEEDSKNSCFFGLLDGHGHYGKTASHIAGYCISQILSKEVPDIPKNLAIADYIEQILFVLNRGFSHAHDSVINANISSKKDFGTTCIVVGIVDQYLVTANCGDSSAICIVPNLDRDDRSQQKPGYKPGTSNSGWYHFGGIGNDRSFGTVFNDNIGCKNINCTSSSSSNSSSSRNNNLNDHVERRNNENSKILLPDLPVPISYNKSSSQMVSNFHGIYYLSNPHCLNRKSERQRIDQSGVGKVVLGDYGMLRLIPSYLSYSQARDLGLSISMSRSLGHMHLSRCALLPTPDYRIMNLGGNPPRKECINSIRRQSVDSQKAKIEDEKMACFSEALIEQSVIAIGWGNRPSICKRNDHIENIELDWSTDDESFSNHLAINGGDSKPWRDSYIVIMSDGVSDILDGFAIADIIVESQDKSMQEIAGLLTSEAERKRRINNIRADNCTVIVVHLRNRLYDQIASDNNDILESPAKPCNNVNLNNSICIEKAFIKNHNNKANTNTSTINTCNTSDTSIFSNHNNVLGSPTNMSTWKSSETPIRSFKPNPMCLHRTVTPIQRRRKITTPSPARAKTCKIREVPNIFIKNQN